MGANPTGSMMSFAALALLAFVPLFFLTQAVVAGPRSRRYVNLALACGLAGLFVPELLTFDADSDGSILKFAGLARAGIAILGLAFVLLAFVRRGDGGLGVFRPTVAATCCLLHLLLGLGVARFGQYLAPSPPWIYTAPGETFQVTLPSARWLPRGDNAEQATLFCLVPTMQATVRFKKDQSAGEFAAAKLALMDRVRGEAAEGQKVTKGEGPISDGRELFSLGTLANDGRRLIHLVRVLVLNPKKQAIIEIDFEGHFRSPTDEGRAAEAQAFQRAAETIAQSVQ